LMRGFDSQLRKVGQALFDPFHDRVDVFCLNDRVQRGDLN